MTGWALMVLAVFWAVLVGFLSFVLINLFRVLTSARDMLEDFRRQTVPMLEELNETVETMNKELTHVDALLTSTRGTVGAVESIAKTANAIFTHPAIRLMAVAAGTGRAYRRLRGGRSGEESE